MSMEIIRALEELALFSMRRGYRQLEQDTKTIIYPIDAETPLVVDHKVMQARRVARNAVLRDALESRRVRLTELK